MIRVELLFFVFTMLRYPLPTSEEVSAYAKELGSSKLSFIAFLRTPSWMDKFDEKLIKDLTPDSQYLTINYKKLLFWIFRNKEGKLTPAKLISALRCFEASQRKGQNFFQFIT